MKWLSTIKFTAAGLLVFLTLDLWSQQAPPNLDNVSPDAKMLSGGVSGSALDKMTTPDLFNGSLNINIPLYQFSYGQADYGVNLSYNTQGIKVDEIASSVGLHWNLNTGPTITRVLKDIPDEIRVDGDSVLMKPYNQDPYGNYQDTVKLHNHEMHLYGKWYSGLQLPNTDSNIYRDQEPDEFIASIGGTTFKFYIDKNFKSFTIPKDNYGIQVLLDSQVVTNLTNDLLAPKHRDLNFVIKDNQGNTYFFEPFETQSASYAHFEDLRKMGYGTDGEKYVVTWRIKRILLSNGQFIDYHYNGNVSGNGHIYIPYRNDFVGEHLPGSGWNQLVNYYASSNSGIARSLYGSTRLLSQIDYPNGQSLVFQYDAAKTTAAGESVLKQIQIIQGTGCKSYHFYIDSLLGRYYLDSLTQGDCSGYDEPFYKFQYNTNKLIRIPVYNTNEVADSSTFPPVITPLPGSTIIGYDSFYLNLPRRLNVAQDLYGYYNGDPTGGIYGANHPIIVPKHRGTDGVVYGNKRSYNPIYAQAGLINILENAYGMKEEFFYGSHYFNSIPLLNSVPSDSLFLGATQPSGVRIDSIVKTDRYQPGRHITTKFIYNGGQIFMPGGYFHQPIEVNAQTGQVTGILFQGQFLSAHQLIHNANQGYSHVNVSKYLDHQLLGTTSCTFTNMSDASSGAQPRYFKTSGSKDYFEYPYTDKAYLKDWEIGLPLSVAQYDENGHILKETINEYDFSPVDLSAANTLKGINEIRISGDILPLSGYYFSPGDPRVFRDEYYPFRGMALLKRSVTNKYYSDSKSVADTVWYEYDDRNNLKNTITQNSRGEKIRTTNIYNYDVDGPDNSIYSHPGTTLYNMSDSGLEIAVGTERWKIMPLINGTLNDDRILSGYLTQFQYQNGRLWKKGLYTLRIGSPLSYGDYNQNGMGSTYVPPFDRLINIYEDHIVPEHFERTLFVTVSDSLGNANEIKNINDDATTAMIWDTVTGNKLAEAANSSYSDIAYTSFEGDQSESNLILTNSNIVPDNSPVSGSNSLYFADYGINGGPETPGEITGKQALTSGKPYILSLWYRSSASVPFTVGIGSQNIPFSNDYIVYQKGDWKNYQVRFTPNQSGGHLTIKNNNASVYLDEIRLYPSDAQMTSRTYTPLFGESSETNAAGRITYFHYDALGRQDEVLDQDGNIISFKKYHVAE